MADRRLRVEGAAAEISMTLTVLEVARLAPAALLALLALGCSRGGAQSNPGRGGPGSQAIPAAAGEAPPPAARPPLRRAEELKTRNIIADAELETARSTFEIARANAELWRTRYAFTQITAPVSGVITAKRVERGGAVSSHQ